MNIPVSVKKGKAIETKHYQVSPYFTRTLSKIQREGEEANEDEEKSRAFLNITDRLGVEAFKQLVRPWNQRKIPSLVGYRFGELSSEGRINFRLLERFYYSFAALGFADKGWHPTVVDDDEAAIDRKVRIVFKKYKERSYFRTFQIGPRVRQLTNPDDHEDTESFFSFIHLETVVGLVLSAPQVDDSLWDMRLGNYNIVDRSTTPLDQMGSKESLNNFFAELDEVLTDDNREVAELILQGLSDAQIAMETGQALSNIEDVRNLLKDIGQDHLADGNSESRTLPKLRWLYFAGDGTQEALLIPVPYRTSIALAGIADLSWPRSMREGYQRYLATLRGSGRFQSWQNVSIWDEIPFSLNRHAPPKIVRAFNQVPQIHHPEVQTLIQMLNRYRNAYLILHLKGVDSEAQDQFESEFRKTVQEKIQRKK